MHWEMASLICVLYGCVDNLHIRLWMSTIVAHLTAKKAYFASTAADNPGTRQIIVTALQEDRNCHMLIVTVWNCQDWSKWSYWIRASQSLQSNAFQTSSMCSYILVHRIGIWWPFLNNMTILAYNWIVLFMPWLPLSRQTSTNSFDSMVTEFPIKTNSIFILPQYCSRSLWRFVHKFDKRHKTEKSFFCFHIRKLRVLWAH